MIITFKDMEKFCQTTHWFKIQYYKQKAFERKLNITYAKNTYIEIRNAIMEIEFEIVPKWTTINRYCIPVKLNENYEKPQFIENFVHQFGKESIHKMVYQWIKNDNND